MKFHWGDFLNRDFGHWHFVPNVERHKYWLSENTDDATVTHITIGKPIGDWQRVFDMPLLEELTLHEPTADQIVGLGRLKQLKRLRITHARPKTLEVLAELPLVSELVLEYVSGFSDISPVGQMPALRALHIENLRRVRDFSPLKQASGLRYLSIHGTFDWKQTIDSIEFLSGLPQLEVLSLGSVPAVDAAKVPTLLEALTELKFLSINSNQMPVETFAEIEVRFPHIEGTVQEAVTVNWQGATPLPAGDPRLTLELAELKLNHPEIVIEDDGRRLLASEYGPYFFLGKGRGMVMRTTKGADERARRALAEYQGLLAHFREKYPTTN